MRIKDLYIKKYNFTYELYKSKEYEGVEICYEKENFDFGTFYVRFLKLAFKLLESTSKINVFEAVPKISFVKNLFSQLEKVALKVLIHEINIFKTELVGDTPEEKYEFYLQEYLKDDIYIDEILELYPVLLKSILIRITDYTNYINFVFEKYLADKDKLNGFFC